MPISLAREAQEHLLSMTLHYQNNQRSEALRYLIEAVETAKAQIAATPEAGLRAPRPYPDLAMAGRLWIKKHRYWIAYQHAAPPVILGIFYETSNIPGQIQD